jgi:acetyl coenzyme A synthetase (ADP forming)-like protein
METQSTTETTRDPAAAPVDGPAPTGSLETLPAVDVLLTDGSTAHVRTVEPGDARAIADLHASLSEESRALRYFAAHPQLSPADLRRMLASGPDDLVLVAERDDRLVALAEYHRAVGSDEAEVAFVVEDDFQGKGLGTILLEHLAAEARRHGVRRFVADTMATNRRMIEVFENAGFAVTTRLEGGDVSVILDIAPSPAALAAADERDRRAVVSSMHRLLRPRSVAVIGASRRPGTIGHELVRNLVRSGFQGPVYPVNPTAASIASLPCWHSIGEVPGEVDLAVIAVPAAAVRQVVGECGHKGVGGLVVVSAGFAEMGAAGGSEQAAITALAHEWGMRLVGPNCFGVLNTEPDVSMNATFSPDQPNAGRVGFASQSGGLGIAIVATARSRGIGLSSFVSMGNKADVSGNDLLQWWESDGTTDVGLLYLESFGNPRKFARLARRVGRRIPIVAVKAGRSNVGRAAASSHTAAMASSDEAVEALFGYCGAVRVDTVEELFDTAEVLANQPLPAGGRVGIITNAGGPGVLAADACSALGLDVPELSEPTQSALWSAYAGAASVRNPVDLVAAAPAEVYGKAVEILARSGEVDSLVVIFTPPLVTEGRDVARFVVDATEAIAAEGLEVPVLVNLFGTESGREILRSGRRPVPSFTYPETAVRALARATGYARWRRLPEPQPAVLDRIDVNEGRRRLVAGGPPPGSEPARWLTGGDAMGVLDAFGVRTARTIDVSGPDEAVAAAGELGMPVVLKAAGASIVHKSDVGGVRVGLHSAEEVRDAYLEMSARIGPAMTGAVVQPMVPPGVEVIVGFVQDPQFGPQVLFGPGGTAVEVLGDHALRLAPLDADEARRMILSVRAAPLLTGYRGSAPVDLDALVDLVLRVSRLAEDLPEVLEADCNPAIASPSGVVVVDARLRVATGPAPERDDRRRLR